MIGEHFPKVSPPSRQSLKSYNAKFVMDKCARNKYGATLTGQSLIYLLVPFRSAVDLSNPGIAVPAL